MESPLIMNITYTELALFAWATVATAVAFARGDKLRDIDAMLKLLLEKEDFYKQVRAAHFKRKES